MALTPGTSLGPYEIVSALGAGAMGEVYRARDTRLDRDVAVKVLPEALAADAERIARFQREAKTLASLNHPSIAQIHGLEESRGVLALVMELVEGEDLSQRIAHAALPLDEAMPIARQVAEALEAAHQQGVIHRDLKPANIKVRTDGTVKVLDFGLAKLVQPEADGADPADVTPSPTITSPVMMTGVGAVLGTAAYMSPEQAKGREADKRSDIWAFGAVLYEMLTGTRAFDGEDMTDVLGAVARLEPNWKALASDVPSPIRTLLEGCLVKDRRRRVADISTVLFVLENTASLAGPAATALVSPPAHRPRWRRLVTPVAAALVTSIVVGTAVWFATRQAEPTPPRVSRLSMAPSGAEALTLTASSALAITPDGSRLVGSKTRAERDVGHLVYAVSDTLRAVEFDTTRLETRGAHVPVVRGVARNTATGILHAVVASDGTLAYVQGGHSGDLAPRTLVWVDRQGRETPIPAPGRRYSYPRLSPDGSRIAVVSIDQEIDIWIWNFNQTTLTRSTLQSGTDHSPLWTPNGGELIFSSDRAGPRNLFKQRADGTGAAERLTESANRQYASAVSSDGRRVIFTETTPKTGDDVMQIELDGSHRVTPLIQSASAERNGVISPDGRWLAYESNASGRFEVWVRPFPDVTSGQSMVSTAGGTRPRWTRSGQELVYVSPSGALMRVGVARGATWSTTPPTLLINEGYVTRPPVDLGITYDIAPDGERFLMIKEAQGSDQTAPASVIVVLNWQEELKQRVSTR